MEYNKQKINKFIKKSGLDNDPLPNNEDDKFIKEGKTLSNIEAFELGKFPDNLVEKVSLPEIDRKDYIDSEIKPKHLELLKDRPIPDMLESSKLVGKLKQIDSPSLGKFYEEKKVDETMKKEKYPDRS
tara:strand:+ start:3504 stop:3887 length:384 start_codon:yes stop_codon:yes gene_type:complete